MIRETSSLEKHSRSSFNFSKMNGLLLILSVLFLNPVFGQIDSTAFVLEDKTIDPCNRTWMMSETEMTLLKREIREFEQMLLLEAKDRLMDYTGTYERIYRSEDVERIEFDGQRNVQHCAQRDSSEIKLDERLQTDEKIESYGRKYAVKTSFYYYIGNATITTVTKEYYIRKD